MTAEIVDANELRKQEDIPTRKTKNRIFKSEKAKKNAERSEYIPIIDPKQTIEIAVKQKPTIEELQTVEKPGRKIAKKRTYKRKYPSKTRKTKTSTSSSAKTYSKFKPPKNKALSGDSILIITEKPQAASKISAALSNGKARQTKASAGVYFYEFNKEGENIIVACAVGHLFSLSQDIKGTTYPIYDISWKPNSEVRKKDFTRKYYTAISKLVKRAKQLIVATDYDTEGEVIGYNVVRFIAGQKDAKRMKFSSLTKPDLEKAYANAEPTLDWGQALGGETRHYIDWFYGINLSRALMNAIKTTGKFKIMSIGRVQGPALNLIVNKEKEIKAFKPEPFWKVFLDVHEKADPNNKLKVKYLKDIKDKTELENFKDLDNKEAEASTKKTQQILQPPAPFDLTTLQTEAYKFFSLTPSKTLQVAQHLYLAGVISYPRTSSQKIPEAINPKQILKRLKENSDYKKAINLTTRSQPIEGKKSDPAHPSIYPTGEFQMLSGDDKKIYDLITRRFISCFCEDAEIEYKTITIEINNLKFKAKGLEVIKRAWMEVYKTKLKEQELQDMNGIAIIDKTTIEQDETKPPKRFSPASIVRELEKRGLGTKATRANILETLYKRGYVIDNKSIKATSLGISLIESLEKHSPIIIDEQLTRTIEKDMEEMSNEKLKTKLQDMQKKVLQDSKTALDKISKDFHKDEKLIGQELVVAREKAWKQEAIENSLQQCPVCKQAKLMIRYSPKYKRSFVGCTGYPKCTTTYTLPPNGVIKKANKQCEHCNFPMLMRLSKGKRPWIFCFNPNCKSRQEQEQRQKEKLGAQQNQEQPAN
jgi:DNA topoisomerase I